jgi:cytochrome c
LKAHFFRGQSEALVDSFEWNKIAGWVLTAAIAVLGLSIVTGMIYSPHAPEKAAYVVEGVELEAEAGAAAATEKPIAFYLASASAEKGEAVFKKCAACHTVNAGGANGIGPNVHAIVGAKVAGKPGFGYSSALQGKGGNWTFDALNEWLKSPKAYVPGNKMSFAGLGKPEDRAAVILYLNSQGSNLPLPAVPAEVAAAAPADAAPAGPVQATAAEKPTALPSKAPDVPEATPEANVKRGGPGATDVTGRGKDDQKQP